MHWPKLHCESCSSIRGEASGLPPRSLRHRGALLLLGLLLAASVCPAQNNRALKLDGQGSYVELPPDIFRDLTQATVEVWAKWDEFQNYSRVVEFGSAWQSMSLFNHANLPDLRFNLYPRYAKNDPSLQNIIRVPGLLRSNEWIHLAAVSGPGGMQLYANGRLVGQHTNTVSFAGISVLQTNLLGRGLARNPTDRDFHGEMDELRVWNHRRTAAQIRDNMFKRLSGKEAGLAHLWNFDDGTADDVTSGAQHGKLIGNAKIVPTDLGLVVEVVVVPPPAPAPAPATNFAPAATVPTVTAASTASPGVAVWWIAGALVALVALLAWLVFLLKRSGLGSPRLLEGTTARVLTAEKPAASESAVAGGDRELKDRALAELTSFAKESLVQGLYSQRAALLDAQKQAQQELTELETRFVALRLPDRIQAYEKRIAELEAQLETRGGEIHELTHATLQLLRQKLEEEKLKEGKDGRFN